MSATTDPIFAKIAKRYDTLNRVMSFGQDQKWRLRGIASLPKGSVLDLGSGTGAGSAVFGDRTVVALDPVTEMLGLSPIDVRVAAVGERLPFDNESFDGAFSAYVFRNLTSIPETLSEVARVIKPGGKLIVIGLTRPKNRALAMLHRLVSSLFLPFVGMLVGAREEYAYLHRSMDKLPAPEVLFQNQPLALEEVWRMGPMGFVYGAVLGKQ
jgi:demethylmenaquinone methyltransferase/2-methoxy-6-polyprenyl-1,4-benzoquinol methylase